MQKTCCLVIMTSALAKIWNLNTYIIHFVSIMLSDLNVLCKLLCPWKTAVRFYRLYSTTRGQCKRPLWKVTHYYVYVSFKVHQFCETILKNTYNLYCMVNASWKCLLLLLLMKINLFINSIKTHSNLIKVYYL